eukprot:CAMPEP_0171258318 /NCGR_PEP_ID=MMETSP0790-20130122/54316_1 /TAXON_ID=2925 /ORGANISM="Alexandrium catenella, Strain OF101" /LENGTH=45 /DNA_ID= /DNA_START= /DNA_END= /DNA_ORIENTATION=
MTTLLLVRSGDRQSANPAGAAFNLGAICRTCRLRPEARLCACFLA